MSDDQQMLPLFDVPFDRLDVGGLRRFLGEAGDEGLTWEAKADHESGRLRPQQIHKAACGLANQIGGYLILGARRDAKGEPWQLPGINPRDDEIDVWIGNVLRRLRPEPRHQTRAWEVDHDRLVAVVWIDPVDRPPCIAPDGRVFQRVSGATVPVEDPAELARLQQRGQAALDRALTFADRAATRALMTPDWIAESAAAVSIGIAPFGRETDDISSRLFTEATGEALVKAGWAFARRQEPSWVDLGFEQDALTAMLEFGEQLELQADHGAIHKHRESWLVMASWDGAAATAACFSSDALIDMSVIEQVIQPGWAHAVQAVRDLGGYGPAQATVLITAGPAPEADEEDENTVPSQAEPPAGSVFADLPLRTVIRRQTPLQPIGEELLGSVHRELLRAARRRTYEIASEPDGSTPPEA